MKTATPEQLEKIGLLAAGLVTNGQRVGLGSGKAALAFVRALGQRITHEKLQIIGVPTSVQTEQVARQIGIPLGTLYDIDSLDITIDGADEVDPDLNLIKGGGGYLTREKVVASISKRFIIVVGEEKLVPQLAWKFPVFLEVLEFARSVVTRRVEAMGATVTPRKNPDGSLYLTDNQNPYLHCQFPPQRGLTYLGGAQALDRQFHQMPGVIETALFIGMAQEVIIARADGTIDHKKRA
ncbi:MAG TPA: ribose 5-phosphate isomerase A [Phycisphaerae bacterium]|jgi:ribose 5-phosphate isomerase A